MDVRFSALPVDRPLHPGKFLVLIYISGSVFLRISTAGRKMSIKKSNNFIRNRNRDLTDCSVVPQPTITPCGGPGCWLADYSMLSRVVAKWFRNVDYQILAECVFQPQTSIIYCRIWSIFKLYIIHTKAADLGLASILLSTTRQNMPVNYSHQCLIKFVFNIPRSWTLTEKQVMPKFGEGKTILWFQTLK
jgi:hypothetical protein